MSRPASLELRDAYSDSPTTTSVNKESHKIDAESDSKAADAAGDLDAGGWSGLQALIGAWMLSFSSFGVVNSFGAMQTYLRNHQLANESPANVSLVGSIQYCLLLASGLFVGRIFDRGYLNHLCVFGTLATTFSIMMLSLCTELYQVILSYGLLTGLGLGCLYVPSVACLAQWYTKRRLFIIGISATGSSIGGVVFPIALERMFATIGYGWTIRVFAFIELAVCTIGSLLIKARFVGRDHGSLFDLSPYRQPAYALLAAGVLCAALGLYLPIFYASAYAEYIGVDTQLAFYLVAIISAASFFGRLFPPLLSDRYGAIPVIAPVTFFAGASALMLPLVKPTASLVIYDIAYGFLSGAYVAIVSAAGASITQEKDMPRLGHRQGLLFATSAPGALAVGPICGRLVTAAGGRYFGAAIWAGTITIIGSVLIAAAGMAHARAGRSRPR